MSLSKRIKVQCDWPGCFAGVATGYSKAGFAREEAAKVGFLTVGGHDFCGPPSPKSDPHAYDRPADHAERIRSGGHRPVQTPMPGRPGVFTASCTCGWDPPHHLAVFSSRMRATQAWLYRHLTTDVVFPKSDLAVPPA